MEYVFVIIGFVMLLTGLAGCFLPAIPGPPLAFVGLIFISISDLAMLSTRLIWILGTTTLFVTLLDYFIPAYGAKRFGGTKFGMWGAVIGLVGGMFLFPPFGIIVGPLIGALIGELMAGQREKALKSAFGTFIGFLTGLVLKLALCVVLIYYGVIALT